MAPNIGGRGRLVRGVGALCCLIGGLWLWETLAWLSVLLLLSAAVIGFEALRGWCLLRACGIRTRL